jgi:hypothetical protein
MAILLRARRLVSRDAILRLVIPGGSPVGRPLFDPKCRRDRAGWQGNPCGVMRRRATAATPAPQDILIAQVVRPAVGVEDCMVKRAVGEVQPGGALVVAVRQRPALQFLFGGAGRVEPGVMPSAGFTTLECRL